jgi:hypothetical protein
VAAARPRWHDRLDSNSGEHRCNAGQQTAVRASLGHRGGVEELVQWWDRTEVLVHRGGGNGGRRRACAHAGGEGLPFIGTGEAEGACEHHLKGREEELRGSPWRLRCLARRWRVAQRGSGRGAGRRKRVEECVPRLLRAWEPNDIASLRCATKAGGRTLMRRVAARRDTPARRSVP